MFCVSEQPVSINTANRVADRLERSVVLRIMYFFKFVANSIRLFFHKNALDGRTDVLSILVGRKVTEILPLLQVFVS